MARGVAFAIAAAALFGLSTPASKWLLRDVDPILLAALLYLSTGVGLEIGRRARDRLAAKTPQEARLKRADLPFLFGAVLSGGVVAPVLLFLGLATTAASTSALLLNLEGALTAAIAWIIFKEAWGSRVALGMAAIVAGGLLLSWSGAPLTAPSALAPLTAPSALAPLTALNGPLAITGACLGWAIDNNLTRRISAVDPLQIGAVKGLVAGSVNLAIALARGATPPPIALAPAIVLVGFVSYGISLALYVLALRSIGAARASAYFSLAPFLGAAASVALLGDKLSANLLGAAAMMGLGVYLHMTERHEHPHEHARMEHEHRHIHDEHHRHAHAEGDPPGEPHSHWHVHEPITHTHPHYPDIHHHHSH